MARLIPIQFFIKNTKTIYILPYFYTPHLWVPTYACVFSIGHCFFPSPSLLAHFPTPSPLPFPLTPSTYALQLPPFNLGQPSPQLICHYFFHTLESITRSQLRVVNYTESVTRSQLRGVNYALMFFTQSQLRANGTGLLYYLHHFDYRSTVLKDLSIQLQQKKKVYILNAENKSSCYGLSLSLLCAIRRNLV